MTQELSIDTTVEKIQEFTETIDKPGNWMIVIPTDAYDSVKDALETDDSGLGTTYNGVSLCYGEGRTETKVRYTGELDEYLESTQTDTNHNEVQEQ